MTQRQATSSVWRRVRGIASGIVPAGTRLFHERILLTLTVGLFGGVGVLLWQMSATSSDFVETAARQDAARTSEALTSFRRLYTSEVVDRVRSQGIEVTHDYEAREGSIPLPATLSMKLGDMISREHTGSLVRLFSDHPFPWREDGGPRDAFEAEALVELRRNPDQPFVRVEDRGGRLSLRYATADRMQASCVACHNAHPDSPKTDWQVGDVRGVLEVVRPLDGFVAQVNAQLRACFLLFMTLAVFGLAAAAFFIVSVRRSQEACERRTPDANEQACKGGDIELTASASPRKLLLLGVVASGAILAADLSIPLGVAVGVPYILLVLLSLRSNRESHVVVAAVAGTALTILGFILSPVGGVLWQVLANRLLAIFAVWVTAILCLWQKRRTSEQVLLVAEKTAAQDENSLVKETLRKLEKSEGKLRTVIEASKDAMIAIGEDGRVKLFNPAAEEMFGRSAHEMLGEPLECLMPEDFRQQHGEYVAGFFAHGEPNAAIGKTVELPCVRSDGSQFPVELSLSEGRQGEDRIVLAIIRDITDRKLAEEQVEDVNKQLQSISRQAGMAEIATGVLHNVGNVLNSVNVSASLVTDKIRKSKVSGLAKASALMREHTADLGTFIVEDEKGKKLPGYLAKLAEHLTDEQGSILEELESLTRNVEHIKKIVSAQQSHAGTFGVTESVSIADVVDAAVSINSASFDRHGIEVVCEYTDVPRTTIDKQKLLAILVNLVQNAKHAVFDGERENKRLTLRVQMSGDDRVRIEVSDNGVGIPNENLTRVFAHGFTTKKSGHGFGLHSAALAAKEMGGSLIANSDGPGKGATFTIELPLESAEVHA